MSLPSNIEIRESTRSDWAAIESLYPEAFPDENLLPLVRDLLKKAEVTISLVAITGADVVANVIFTACGVVGNSVKAALLAPLAVMPAWQRQGVGSALVRAGLGRLKKDGVERVFVLGDPAYYGRLGFLPDALVEPPYPLPAEWESAWQSQDLAETGTRRAGKLSVPPLWLHEELWAP